MEELFVNRVRLNRENINNNVYPFNIKCLNNFKELKIDNSVTLFYGENGVGKSTLIEAIAISLGLNPEGGSNNMQFSNYDDYSELYKHLTISKFRVPKTKFFLRAESFYNVATDISNKALEIAKKNAKINEVENRITFISSDLFTNIPEEKYDIIVSNPPYIKRNVIETLDEQVRKEPYMALDGGLDGLDFYRKIIKNSYEYLKYHGFLCLEIGFDQKIDVIELIENEEKFENTYSKKDLFDNDRIIITQLNLR